MRPTLMAQRQLCNTRRPRVTGTSVACQGMELPVRFAHHAHGSWELDLQTRLARAQVFMLRLFSNVVWAPVRVSTYRIYPRVSTYLSSLSGETAVAARGRSLLSLVG